MGNTVAAACPHTGPIVDDYEPGCTIDDVVQAVALSPVKPLQIRSHLPAKAAGRIGHHRNPWSFPRKGLESFGTRAIRNGDFIENRAGHLQAEHIAAHFDKAGFDQQDGR